jgi:hypothetical protein
MDLVYPDDRAIVMSAWNTLLSGKALVFEMRWKGATDGEDAAQWVLSSCLPVFDEDKNLISIAGSTFDINPIKRLQMAAAARLEALELARVSERKFTRFAELAPISITMLTAQKGIHSLNSCQPILIRT